MIKKLLFSSWYLIILTALFFFVNSVPAKAELKTVKGEANGTFTFQGSFSGTGMLTFINTGGDAHLTTICDISTVDTAAGERCEGVDLNGTFSGGRNGTAVFTTATGGELKLPLSDGKVFSFSTQGISMKFTVSDPSIFDDVIENTGGRDSGARASDLSGQVEIACPPDLEAWDVMKMGRVIYVDCHLKTREDSSAVISFSDMTTFEMKAESEIVIDTPPEKDSKWSLLVGNVWVNVKQMMKDGTMKTHMSQAVAGIKGTTFVLSETGSESSIKVIEGVVNFQSLATGDAMDIASGEAVTATSNGLSEKTLFNTSVEEKNWQKDNESVDKKSLQTINSNPKMIYLIGASAIVLIVIVAGVTVLKKRKQIN